MNMYILFYLATLMFFLYFIVLFTERVISIVRSAQKKEMFTDGLSRYMYGLAFLSLGATVVLLAIFGRKMIATLLMLDKGGVPDLQYLGVLSLISGIILFSGMVHTNYTIPGIQFGAYGALIVAIILRGVMATPYCPSVAAVWITVVYITVFSMAVPVVYRSKIEKAKIFHTLECIVSGALVVALTFMMWSWFAGDFRRIYSIGFILAAILGDAFLIAMRWKEEKNWFVLIFLIASVVMYGVGTGVMLLQHLF